MIQVLQRIVQEVNAAHDLEQALRIIVSEVKDAMDVDVCSVYLMDEQGQKLGLMASQGLYPESVGKVQMGMEEGLVGLVAQRAEPVNLQNAPDHRQFRYFPETGEERYRAFLGVPVIHHREVMGVLVVQQHAEARFSEEMVAFLVTIASQLAGAIAHARISGGLDGLQNRPQEGNKPLQGQPGAPGIVIGTAVAARPFADLDSIPDRPVEDEEAEREHFLEAVRAVRAEIEEMVDRMRGTLPSGEIALFEAYLMMLGSESMVDATLARIRGGNWAAGALRETIQEHVHMFESMEDAYLRERAQDVRDLGRRLLERLLMEEVSRPAEYPINTVLVGEEITAAMLAEIPPDQLAGVVSVRGSRTSHTAILARAMEIPAVMGCDDLPVSRVDRRDIIADGYSGRVYIDPSPGVCAEYARLQREEEELSADLKGLRHLISETPDGHRIPLYANTGLVSDIQPSLSSGAEGIGLYRTEFPFMARDRFPGEEEQCRVYHQVLETFSPRPVTMRTLDVGGDKALPYFPIQEDNPFLGWRGIRLTLDHPEIFLVQIRAMLRASAGLDNLRLLLPMISTVGEVDESVRLIRRAREELLEEGVEVAEPQVGVMVEVPSAVYLADSLARRTDFLSVGTNDLTQYLLAVDRNNARVADLYDSLHPAVLRALLQIVEGAHRHGKPVSVCGEMASDPAAVILLIGMDIDGLSTSASALPRTKWVVRSFSHAGARELLEEVLEMEDATTIRRRLSDALEEAGLGGLIRAGK